MSSFPEWFWLRLSHEARVKKSGLQGPDDLNGWRIYWHAGELTQPAQSFWLLAWGLSSSPSVQLPKAAWVSSWCLPTGWSSWEWASQVEAASSFWRSSLRSHMASLPPPLFTSGESLSSAHIQGEGVTVHVLKGRTSNNLQTCFEAISGYIFMQMILNHYNLFWSTFIPSKIHKSEV